VPEDRSTNDFINRRAALFAGSMAGGVVPAMIYALASEFCSSSSAPSTSAMEKPAAWTLLTKDVVDGVDTPCGLASETLIFPDCVDDGSCAWSSSSY
jgi:hypothetical protein